MKFRDLYWVNVLRASAAHLDRPREASLTLAGFRAADLRRLAELIDAEVKRRLAKEQKERQI